ncbi:Replicase polyprotein 1ab [Catellatospora chokoriensis]|uniref:Replicase polyprotein 1ab n=1 Tax=Catellatospora chokoriensis TaxID=310353 RepID=UPI001EF3B877|nr:Replicase polyprotein 1ab [Catellatospora chokoriensis]
MRAELLSLAKPVADTVARHLVATGQLIDDDPEKALEHALAARRLASRIAVVREAVGLAAYQTGDWASAIAEIRTYHRMTGRQTHLAVLADCERALGRPEKAIDLFRGVERDKLSQGEALELLIVAAGARGDMGQHEAAAAMLQVRELTVESNEDWSPRLRYAYADSLLASGRTEEAREWFAKAAAADTDAVTDAAERLLELDGVEIEDEDEGDDESADRARPASAEAAGSDESDDDEDDDDLDGEDYDDEDDDDDLDDDEDDDLDDEDDDEDEDRDGGADEDDDDLEDFDEKPTAAADEAPATKAEADK